VRDSRPRAAHLGVQRNHLVIDLQDPASDRLEALLGHVGELHGLGLLTNAAKAFRVVVKQLLPQQLNRSPALPVSTGA
jgi:hypothetical protein